MKLHSEGEGAPLLVLGGQFMPRSHLEPVVSDLSRFMRVITADLPNFPQAPVDPSVNSMGSYARVLCAALEEAGIGEEGLIGFGVSFGAELLRAMTLLRGYGFRELILGSIGPLSHRQPGRDTQAGYASMIRSGKTREFWESYLIRVGESSGIGPSSGTASLIRTLEAWYDNALPAFASLLQASQGISREFQGIRERYSFPVTLIAGNRDRKTMKNSREFSDEVGVKLVTIDAGHMLLNDNYADSMDAVYRVLKPHIWETSNDT